MELVDAIRPGLQGESRIFPDLCIYDLKKMVARHSEHCRMRLHKKTGKGSRLCIMISIIAAHRHQIPHLHGGDDGSALLAKLVEIHEATVAENESRRDSDLKRKTRIRHAEYQEIIDDNLKI